MKPKEIPHFRIQVDDDYTRALGRALFNYSYLEWAIIWLGETCKPGSITGWRKKTSQEIRRDVSRLATNLSTDISWRQRIVDVAAAMEPLVNERNALVHGAPYTAKGGAQQLNHNGRHGVRNFDTQDILELALRFEALAIEATKILHDGPYASYVRAKGGRPPKKWQAAAVADLEQEKAAPDGPERPR